MSASVELKDISIRFKSNQGQSSALKEAVMRLLSPPKWQKQLAPGSSEFWGVHGISLSLRPGDRLGIIGKNGAGKSTLLKIISRVYRPTLGEVAVAGRLVPLIEIGAGFHPELSGRENIFLNGAILGLRKDVLKDRLQSIIEFSELKDFIDMPVKYYSTGMSMRLAFTVATEVPPEILILDELYAGGDASFINKANKRLQKLVDDSQILITVAHNLEYITQFCNRAIVMDHGRIIATGEPQDLCERYTAFCNGDSTVFQSRLTT